MPHELPCHRPGCEGSGRSMMLVHVQSHEPDRKGVLRPSHLNAYRWFCFCSDDCRVLWYAEPTDEGLVPEEHRAPTHRHLRAVAMNVDPGKPTRVHDIARHKTHAELDAYWQSPGHPAPVNPEDLAP